VPPSKVIQILDRYIMYYIETADKLQRTARWIENYEGGIEKLKRVILDDELVRICFILIRCDVKLTLVLVVLPQGICKDLEASMARLVGTYECKACSSPD
jgi:nitrite reductase (NAD(P)H)